MGQPGPNVADHAYAVYRQADAIVSKGTMSAKPGSRSYLRHENGPNR